MGQIKKFELFILRPLHILFLICSVLALVKGMWLFLIGCVFDLFYLGIIGSNLHPLQSFSDLVKGPLKNPVAVVESEVFSDTEKKILVGHACTRVGILIGISFSFLGWALFSWRWYLSILCFYPIMIISGGILKFFFKTVEVAKHIKGN